MNTTTRFERRAETEFESIRHMRFTERRRLAALLLLSCSETFGVVSRATHLEERDVADLALVIQETR